MKANATNAIYELMEKYFSDLSYILTATDARQRQK